MEKKEINNELKKEEVIQDTNIENVKNEDTTKMTEKQKNTVKSFISKMMDKKDVTYNQMSEYFNNENFCRRKKKRNRAVVINIST